MEYTRDEIFQIKYNTKLDRLQIGHRNRTSRILKMIKKHKLVITILVTIMIFSIANIIMIYNFMRILQNI